LAALALSACSSMPDVDSFRGLDFSTFRPTSKSVLRDVSLRPVTAEDLVDNEGRCAPAFVSSEPPPADGSPPPPVAPGPAMAGGIGLDMTECEVVKRAGQPERVEIGTNERSERTAVLTYIRGIRPGIYYFTSGRLTTLERGPEPPPEPKPAKKPAPKKKRVTT
jgi:hypothetical protein